MRCSNRTFFREGSLTSNKLPLWVHKVQICNCSHDECTVHHILVLINCEYCYHSGSSVCPNSFHSTRVPHSFWYTGDQLVPINIQLHLGRNILLSDSLATIVRYSLRIATQEFHSWGCFDDTSCYGCAHLWDLKWQSNHLSKLWVCWDGVYG